VKKRPVRLKRVYEPPSAEDGTRVLVDGLWPRGLTKHAVSADLWLREAAPSTGLRRWFGHDPRRWEKFSDKYRCELRKQPAVLDLLDDLRRSTPLTLIYGARDEKHSHALVLREVLKERSRIPHRKAKARGRK
jgi:uncharacterized protein YeaO (DUF488 family)